MSARWVLSTPKSSVIGKPAGSSLKIESTFQDSRILVCSGAEKPPLGKIGPESFIM
jgi:hypothetical protein